MRRIDFPHYIKPLLRDTGLTLLAIYLFSSVLILWPGPSSGLPEQALQTVIQFLDLSSLLALALLMLALSLAEFSTPKEGKDRLEAATILDQALMRGRFLVATAAIIFLLMIPFSLFQAQLLRNLGTRGLEHQTYLQKQQLLRASKELAEPGIKEQNLPVLMQRYSQIIGLDIVRVRSLADLRFEVARTLKELPNNKRIKKSQAEQDLLLRVVRISLYCLLYSSLFAYIWLYWPKASRVLQQRVPLDLGHGGEE